MTLRDAAKGSVGSVMTAKSLELQHTIRLIHELDIEIEDIETVIQSIMDEVQSPHYNDSGYRRSYGRYDSCRNR